MSILDSSSSLENQLFSFLKLYSRLEELKPSTKTVDACVDFRDMSTAFLSVHCRHLMSLLLEGEDMVDDLLPHFIHLLPYLEHLIVEPVLSFILGPALLELENVCRNRKSLINHFPNHGTLAVQNRLLSEYLN